nr:hypothetical protein [Streptomyces rubrogriseus]
MDFGELQARARRRGASAREVAGARPVHLIVFDVLETADSPLLDQPYSERRTLLEDLFADGVLAAPFVLCPATTDRATAADWLDPAWGAVGIEGVVVKGLTSRYTPGRRGWLKVRASSVRRGCGRRGDRPCRCPVHAAPRPLGHRGPAPVHRPHDSTDTGSRQGARRTSPPGRRKPPLDASQFLRGLGE